MRLVLFYFFGWFICFDLFFFRFGLVWFVSFFFGLVWFFLIFFGLFRFLGLVVSSME